MNINNTYKVYCYLYKKYHPTRVVMPLKECIHNLTHSLLQRGASIRKRGYGTSPSPTKDIRTSSSVEGRKVRKDSVRQPKHPPPAVHGTGAIHFCSSTSDVSSRTIHKQQQAFRKWKRHQTWRRHQSVPNLVTGSGPHCM
jgi:hypothetical protein